MRPFSIAAGCVLMLALLPAHAQMPRFKPLVESEMTDAQRKAAAEIASGPRGRFNPDGPNALLLRSPDLVSRNQKVGGGTASATTTEVTGRYRAAVRCCGVTSTMRLVAAGSAAPTTLSG